MHIVRPIISIVLLLIGLILINYAQTKQADPFEVVWCVLGMIVCTGLAYYISPLE